MRMISAVETSRVCKSVDEPARVSTLLIRVGGESVDESDVRFGEPVEGVESEL